jgi:hypothetical protein
MLFSTLLAAGLALGGAVDARALLKDTPQCSMIPKGNSAHLYCGSFGSINPSKASVLSNLTTSDLSACAYACNNAAGCKAVGYSLKKKNNCQLYGKSLKDMGLQPASSGAVQYYNEACFKQACAPTSTSTSSACVCTASATSMLLS